MAIQPVTADTATTSVAKISGPDVTSPATKDSAPPTPPSGDSVTSGTGNSTLKLYHEISVGKEAVNAVAAGVRASENALDAAGKPLETMKKTLDDIVKNFPPFPPGDEGRVKLLKSYSSLRHQIDSMTFPPPPDFDSTKLPSEEPISATGSQASAAAGIPALPQDASNAEIHAAIAAVTKAQESLQTTRDDISSQFGSIQQAPVFEKINPSTAGIGSDFASGSVSHAAGQALSQSGVGITNSGLQFLQRLNG